MQSLLAVRRLGVSQATTPRSSLVQPGSQNPLQKQLSPGLARSNLTALGLDHRTDPILHLQRTIGNQAVQRMLQTNAEELMAGLSGTASPLFGHDVGRISIHPSTAIQMKLVVNKPGDEYEQEADRVSEQVMRTLEPQPHRARPCGVSRQTWQLAQGHGRLQTKHVGSGDLEQIAVPPIVDQVLSSPAQPLDSATRSLMGPRFGHDFSRVRVHSDQLAARSAESVAAQAYTVGSDVVFGAGRYAPASRDGQRLIAHELAHVVQQNNGPVTLQRQPQPQTQPQPSMSPGSPASLSDLNAQITIIGETQIPFEIWRRNFGPNAKPDEHILIARKIGAAERLGDLKDARAVPTLVAVLNDNVFAVQRLAPVDKALVVAAAAEALAKIGGKQALSELSKMLNDADLSKRKMAAVAFKHMRGKDVAAELLARLIKESDTDVKADVVIALGEVGQDLGAGPDTKLVVDELIKILNNSQTVALKWLISNTIQALGKLKDKRATKDLLKAIHNWRSDESILIHGLNALGLLGDADAVDYLDTWLRLSTSSSVRLAAADALGKIGGKIAIAKLQKRLESKQESDPKVIKAIKGALKIP